MREILEQGLRSWGLDTQCVEKLEKYGELLLERNRHMNLTAITDPAEVARLHFLDSAGLFQAGIDPESRLLDVGSGAGLPGLAVKIVEPRLSVTLLDAQGKRVDFLRETAEELGLAGVECLHARAEELGRETGYREGFDVVTSRAVADLRMLCELCLPFVKVGGRFLAMKAEDSRAECDAAGRAVSLLGGRLGKAVEYTIPGTGITRRILVVHKVSPTPEAYPRRFARIRKNPL